MTYQTKPEVDVLGAGQYDDHAMACVTFGDCIYDVVQEGAKELQAQWIARARKWNALIDQAVKTGFLGWGTPLVNRKYLSYVLFQPRRMWPHGLSSKELKTLAFAVSAAPLSPTYTRVDKLRGNTDVPDIDDMGAENEARLLAAMQKYARLYEKHIFNLMWDDYSEVADTYAKKIQPLCAAKYGEQCSLTDARNMFNADLENGVRAKTLDVDTTMYRLIPLFRDLIA